VTPGRIAGARTPGNASDLENDSVVGLEVSWL